MKNFIFYSILHRIYTEQETGLLVISGSKTLFNIISNIIISRNSLISQFLHTTLKTHPDTSLHPENKQTISEQKRDKQTV